MKNHSFYSLVLSLVGIILLCISQYLGNVYGDLSKERAIATISVAILGLICWLASFIFGILGLKNKEKKAIIRYSGIIVIFIFLIIVILWAFLLSFSL
ncbi:hypothetical protein [Rummeliibacillus pycnus]|uniref:hypothetical protein n=1 Tax=Rummeliibacillus pycnus TaxID=101070 RepID=UPI0037CA0337